MILQQLWIDADRIFEQTGSEGLPPPMYQWRPIRYVINLDSDGHLIRFTAQALEGKKGARGVPWLVPSMVRASGIRPLLMADKSSYVLGIEIQDPKKPAGKADDRAEREHRAFKNLVQECAEVTGDPDAFAVACFLDGWDPQHPENLPADLGGDDLLSFEVEGRRPTDCSKVQAFWERKLRPPADAGDGASFQCLVSGQIGPAATSSAVMIKGVPGGQSSGTALVSVNAEAFESYGLDRAQTSPISGAASERYSLALNALLGSEDHHIRVGGLVYVFWAARGVAPVLKFLRSEVDPQDVANLLDSYRSGSPWTKIDEAAFHCLALSASGGRVVVRSNIDTTVGKVRDSLARWFERLQLIGRDGKPGKPLGLFALSVAPFRESKDITPDVPRSIADAALTGAPLPTSLMRLAVRRCVAEGDVTYPRAVIINAVLSQSLSGEGIQSMATLNPQDQPVAYHCGRLLAELESIQKEAIKGINATITDRFFGAASTAPARAFGLLLTGAQPHLGKLRKTNGPAYRGSQARLEEIMACIAEFPTTVDIQGQAAFCLGYYHHKAAMRQKMAEGKAAKDLAKAGAGEIIQEEGDLYAHPDDADLS